VLRGVRGREVGPVSADVPDPSAPSVSERIDRHLRRTGGRAYYDDALTNLTINLTRDVLTLVEAALDDEGVDPALTRAVIDRAIYGAVPLPEQVAERKRREEHLIRLVKLVPPSRGAYWPLRADGGEREAGT
jgi:hypothetical protein